MSWLNLYVIKRKTNFLFLQCFQDAVSVVVYGRFNDHYVHIFLFTPNFSHCETQSCTRVAVEKNYFFFHPRTSRLIYYFTLLIIYQILFGEDLATHATKDLTLGRRQPASCISLIFPIVPSHLLFLEIDIAAHVCYAALGVPEWFHSLFWKVYFQFKIWLDYSVQRVTILKVIFDLQAKTKLMK